MRFFVGVRRHVRKLFVVVNKVDLVSPAQAEDVTAFVREQLRNQLGDAEFHVPRSRP